MKKSILLCFFIIYSGESNSEQVKDQASESIQRRSTLMDLINDEIRTIQTNKYSGPELKHRLFELFSEKIKLIKENENLALLKSDPKDIATTGKDSYFQKSKSQYVGAQKFALALIQEYPKYNRISEIYYALAINSRDYGTSLETEQFLKLSIKYSSDNSKTMYNAKTALAEFYYNNKRYSDAIAYYQEILKNSNNEWYGKHLYNDAWCHLKERKFKKALELIKNSFETTKNKKYISMREQINNAIGLFFVQADATHEGIEFFEKNTSPSAPWLLMLVSSSMNKNNFALTEEIIRAALKDTKKRNDSDMELKVRLVQLDIYRESKKDELFFETAINILDLSKKSKLPADDTIICISKIKEVAGFMQINLVKDKTKDEAEFNKEDYKKIMRYFDILSYLDKKNKNQYRYYQGETALSTRDYQTALKYYIRAVMNSKITKDKGPITRKALDAMLSTLELVKMSKQKENEYTIFAFKNFVLIYPISDKSQVIYQKLFSKYFEAHQIKKAINVLLVYKLNYKDDVKIHQEMLTQILDTYIKEKNTDRLAFWINRIEKGYLSFGAEYIQNSIAILGGLLFDKYQAMEKLGKYKEAMNGYESIYDSKQYPIRTKAEAAYALATLNQEQNDSKHSYKWFQKSFELYENKDLIKITPAILALAKGYRLLQSFDLSTELASQISKRFCEVEFVGKDGFYELMLSNSVIENNLSSKLDTIENENRNCHLDKKTIEKSQINNFDHLILNDNLNEVLTYFHSHADNEKMSRQMSRYLNFKFWQAPKNSKDQTVQSKKEIISIIEANPSLKLEEMLAQYNRVLEFEGKIKSLKFTFTSLPKFDDEKFNSELEQYFSIIAGLNTEAIALAKNSTSEEVLIIREVLSGPYYSLISSINSFIPQGVDSKYIAGFKGGMRQIIESLNAKGLQVDQEKTAYLAKNNFFFEIQKRDKFKNIAGGNEILQDNLNGHSAILFSNTLDFNKGQKQ